MADYILRFRLLGLPFHGVGRLELNDTLLAEGIFSIREMSLMMGSGLLLDIPGNARVSPFNLNVPGTTRVAVYLHVLGENRSPDANSGNPETDAGDKIPRVYHRLVLASEQGYPDTVEMIKLAEFEKSPEGAWELSRAYVPPLVQLGTSPFLKDELSALADALKLFQYNLTLDAASHLSGDSLFNVKQCLKRVYEVQRLLANLTAQVHLHPYFLSEALDRLYIDVCFYRNTNPEDVANAYRHDRIDVLIGRINALKKQMQLVKSSPPYLPFELVDNIFTVRLPDDVRKATDVYLLAQKSQISVNLPVEELKLTAKSRLSMVHQMAMHGIPLKRIARPPFQHPFGAEVEFYLIREGEEWDHALNGETITFYNQPELEGSKFYLYWRAGG